MESILQWNPWNFLKHRSGCLEGKTKEDGPPSWWVRPSTRPMMNLGPKSGLPRYVPGSFTFNPPAGGTPRRHGHMPPCASDERRSAGPPWCSRAVGASAASQRRPSCRRVAIGQSRSWGRALWKQVDGCQSTVLEGTSFSWFCSWRVAWRAGFDWLVGGWLHWCKASLFLTC